MNKVNINDINFPVMEVPAQLGNDFVKNTDISLLLEKILVRYLVV